MVTFLGSSPRDLVSRSGLCSYLERQFYSQCGPCLEWRQASALADFSSTADPADDQAFEIAQQCTAYHLFKRFE